MPIKREFRTFKASQIRASEDGKTISGYSAVFNQLSDDLGGYRERVLPGAFSRCLSEKPDVRCLFNHNVNLILGRTKAGTLRLQEDATGLKFDCDLPDTQVGRDVRTSIVRGDIDGCSFAFSVQDQTWRDERAPDGVVQTTRELIDVDVYDVSPVTYPAYPQTTVSMRELRDAWEDLHKEEDCRCNCRACYDGECENCSDHLVRCDARGCRCNGGERSVREDKKHTKRVDGEDLTADCFIIVGDPEKTETWHLPWKFSTEEKTKSHLRNALARFSQLKGVSAEEKAKAWKKLVSLCKKHDIDVSEEDSIRCEANQLAAEIFGKFLQ